MFTISCSGADGSSCALSNLRFVSMDRQFGKNEEGVQVERRWVEPDPAKGHHYYDASEIAPEWHQVIKERAS